MEPRRRQGRIRQARTPMGARHAHAPYAAGEDAGVSVEHRAPVARKRRTRATPHASAASSHITAGSEAPAPAVTWGARKPAAGALASATRAGLRKGISAIGGGLKRIPPGRALSVGIPTALLIALLVWLLTGSYWQARSVRIKGVSDPTLLSLIHAQRLTGCNVFRCDFSAARQAIAASPLVQKVSVTAVYPDTTLVRVTQRQTVAIWRAQGQSWAIGADGVILGAIEREPSLANASAAVVQDAGGVAFAGQTPRPGAQMDAALVAMASQLRMNAVGAGLNPTSLRYSTQDGFTLRANSGALVVFGGPADAQATLADSSRASPTSATQTLAPVTPTQASEGARLQIEAAAAILTQLEQNNVSASLVDVRWGAHPYYR